MAVDGVLSGPEIKIVLNSCSNNFLSAVKFNNKSCAYICSKGFFGELIFWRVYFSEGLAIGRNFAFQNGFGLSIKTVKNTKLTV